MTMLEATRAVSCPTCWAAPGDDCHTAAGKPVRNGHVRRIAQAAGDPERRADVTAFATAALQQQPDTCPTFATPCGICEAGEGVVKGLCEPCSELGMDIALDRVRQDAAEVRAGRLCWGCATNPAVDADGGLCVKCLGYQDGPRQDAVDTLDSASHSAKSGDWLSATRYLDAAEALIDEADTELQARLAKGRAMVFGGSDAG